MTQGVHSVKGEIHNVLTVVRLTSTQAQAYSYRYGRDAKFAWHETTALVHSLRNLHDEISYAPDLDSIDTVCYLRPFLDVIASQFTDIHATSVALQAVQKFLVYGFINLDSLNVTEAIALIVSAVLDCKFDTVYADRGSNFGAKVEAVYMKVLEVLLECLRCPAGQLLPDDAVCAMIREAFNMRAREGVGPLLCRFAENVLVQMVLVMFARLNPGSTIGGRGIPAPVVIPSPRIAPPSSSSIFPEISSRNQIHNRSVSTMTAVSASCIIAPISPRRHRPHTSTGAAAEDGKEVEEETDSGGFHGGYGVPALHRVFRFLVSIINPVGSDAYEEPTRILGLRLVQMIFETAGPRIGDFPELVQVIQEQLCKHLLQNTQTKNPFVLSLVLRIIFNLFLTVKQHLKVQLEVFFTSVHLRIGESQTSSYQQKELVLESLIDLCREPDLIAGLYRNYDCEVGSTNLFEDLCRFLTLGAIPGRSGGGGLSGAGASGGATASASGMPGSSVVGGNGLEAVEHGRSLDGNSVLSNVLSMDGFLDEEPTHFSLLCVEAVLAVLNSIAVKFCLPPEDVLEQDSEMDPEGRLLEDGEAILENRKNKRRFRLAAQRFNTDGSKAMKFLQQLGVLPDPLTPTAVAHFLRTTPGLDKRVVGEYLGSEKAFQKDVLQCYVDQFDLAALAKQYELSEAPRQTSSSRVSVGAAAGMAPSAQSQQRGNSVHSAVSSNSVSAPSSGLPDAQDSSPSPSQASAPMDKSSDHRHHHQQQLQQQQQSSPTSQATEECSGGLPLDFALRYFLDGFRLPGEAQKIERILEAFSEVYFNFQKDKGGPLANAEAVFVLCFSIMMLNTDAHNDNVTRKMTFEDFERNLRGTNGGANLPSPYLREIYDSITTNEIRLLEDQPASMRQQQALLDHTHRYWSLMNSRSRAAGHFQTSAPPVLGGEMFALMWGNSVTILSLYLSEAVLQSQPEESDFLFGAAGGLRGSNSVFFDSRSNISSSSGDGGGVRRRTAVPSALSVLSSPFSFGSRRKRHSQLLPSSSADSSRNSPSAALRAGDPRNHPLSELHLNSSSSSEDDEEDDETDSETDAPEDEGDAGNDPGGSEDGPSDSHWSQVSSGGSHYSSLEDSDLEDFELRRELSDRKFRENKFLYQLTWGAEVFSKICSTYGSNQPFNNLIIALSESLCTLLEDLCIEHGPIIQRTAFLRHRSAQLAKQRLQGSAGPGNPPRTPSSVTDEDGSPRNSSRRDEQKSRTAEAEAGAEEGTDEVTLDGGDVTRDASAAPGEEDDPLRDCPLNPVAVQLAKRKRAVIVMALLFKLVGTYGHRLLLEGWTNLLHFLLWLRQADLLPLSVMEMEDFTDSHGRPFPSLRKLDRLPVDPNNPFYQGRKAGGNSGGRGALGSLIDSALWAFGFGGGGGGGSSGGSSSQDDSSSSSSSSSMERRIPGKPSLSSSSSSSARPRHQPKRKKRKSPKDAQDQGTDPRQPKRKLKKRPAEQSSPEHQRHRQKKRRRARLHPDRRRELRLRRLLDRDCGLEHLFGAGLRDFSPASLTSLLRALILVSASGTQSPHAVNTASQMFSRRLLDAETDGEAAVFCLERISDFLVRLQDQLQEEDGVVWWNAVEQHYEFIVQCCSGGAKPSFYLERVVMNILNLPARLRITEGNAQVCLKLFLLLLRLPRPLLQHFGWRITTGLSMFLKTHSEVLRTKEAWQAVCQILLAFRQVWPSNPSAVQTSWSCVEYLVQHALTPQNFELLLRCIPRFLIPHLGSHASGGGGGPGSGGAGGTGGGGNGLTPSSSTANLLALQQASLPPASVALGYETESGLGNGAGIGGNHPYSSNTSTAAGAGSGHHHHHHHHHRDQSSASGYSAVVLQSYRMQYETMRPGEVFRALLQLHRSLETMPSAPQPPPEEQNSPKSPSSEPSGTEGLTAGQRRRFWFLSLQGWAELVTDPRLLPDTRKGAVAALQRALLSEEYSVPRLGSGGVWMECFRIILLPLLRRTAYFYNQLASCPPAEDGSPGCLPGITHFRVTGYQLQEAMELRLRVTVLVFQTFLHTLDHLTDRRTSQHPFPSFWRYFLSHLQSCMHLYVDPPPPLHRTAAAVAGGGGGGGAEQQQPFHRTPSSPNLIALTAVFRPGGRPPTTPQERRLQQQLFVHFAEWMRNALMVMHSRLLFVPPEPEEASSPREDQEGSGGADKESGARKSPAVQGQPNDLWSLTWAVLDAGSPYLRQYLAEFIQPSRDAEEAEEAEGAEEEEARDESTATAEQSMEASAADSIPEASLPEQEQSDGEELKTEASKAGVSAAQSDETVLEPPPIPSTPDDGVEASGQDKLAIAVSESSGGSPPVQLEPATEEQQQLSPPAAADHSEETQPSEESESSPGMVPTSPEDAPVAPSAASDAPDEPSAAGRETEAADQGGQTNSPPPPPASPTPHPPAQQQQQQPPPQSPSKGFWSFW